MAIRNDIAISIDQVNSGLVESYKIRSSCNIFSLVSEYWVILLGSFFLSFFITYWILKIIIIKTQKHTFLVYRKRFKSILLLQLEVYDMKKKFFTSLNTNKLLTNKLSESAKTYVAMSDKTIHLIRQLPQSMEKPNIKSDNGILVYDIFRKQEKCFSKIVDEALVILSDRFQDKKSISSCFESKGNEVFFGDHDFVFFSLYLIFKEIMNADDLLKPVVKIQSYVSKNHQLVIEIQGFLEESNDMPLKDLEFISVSFNKSKKLLKIIFAGVLLSEESKTLNIKYSGDRGSNVVNFIKP